MNIKRYNISKKSRYYPVLYEIDALLGHLCHLIFTLSPEFCVVSGKSSYMVKLSLTTIVSTRGKKEQQDYHSIISMNCTTNIMDNSYNEF